MLSEIDTNEELIEKIANAMVENKGNLILVSRSPEIIMNAMQLRLFVSSNPSVRERYSALLIEELKESGLHVVERILSMNKMLINSYGDVENDILPNPKEAVELSKEISRLIEEGKTANISGKYAKEIISKEGAFELLEKYLIS